MLATAIIKRKRGGERLPPPTPEIAEIGPFIFHLKYLKKTFFFWRQGLMHPRLASNWLCSTDDLQITDYPPSTSQMLALEGCNTMPGLCDTAGRCQVQGLVHGEQAL